MAENPVHIQFQNSQNPLVEFDLVNLEEVFNKKHIDHSPFQIHLVEFYIIIFIESGEGKHTIDFIEYTYKKGTLLTIRKDQIHKFQKKENVKGKLLLFTDNFLISYLEKLEVQKTLQLFNEIISIPKIQLTEKDTTTVSNLISRMGMEYFEVNDNYSPSIIRSELHVLITMLIRTKSMNNQIITNRKYLSEFISFQQLVENNATKSTRVKEYAMQLGVSTKTLNTITKTIVNKSAKEFIDDICTKQIKRLLINTELSVKEIAYASGFEESTNFYKYFKRQTKLTPEQFRTNFH